MRIYHPDLPPGQTGDVTESSFEKVWRARGWRQAPETSIPVGELTVDEVLDAVDGDPDAARGALIAEHRRDDVRVTLTRPLTSIIHQEA